MQFSAENKIIRIWVMRDMARRLLCSLLVLSMFMITMTWIPEIPVSTQIDSEVVTENNPSPKPIDDNELNPLEEQQLARPNPYTPSYEAPVDGLLNPIQVEQSGYAASENISARTDSYQNLLYDLPLDVAHGWKADLAEVSVWNLEKLYVINGSLDVGVPGTNLNPNGTVEFYPLGWYANSTDDDAHADELQLAAYDTSTRNFVSVENQGYKAGQDIWAHSPGSKIVWSQVIDNAPYTEDFLFSLDYFYLRGPIDGPTGYIIDGNCSLALFIDGTVVWNMSLLLLSQRGVWYDTGQIPITIPGAPSTFLLEVGIIVDELLVLEKKRDYDGNGVADGIENAAYITVYMDDISFVKAIPPTAEQVQLEFTTGGVSSALTGSMGTYSASIENSSYWTATPVSVFLSANTSVSFDYETRLYSHRFTDSNWRTNIDSIGVAYTVDHGLSADLTFYAYVGYLGQYENPDMTIVFPSDWENLTVSDPFLTDLTSTCNISSGSVTIPTSIIDRLGWWEVKLESPNYAKSIRPQIHDITWIDATTFRIGNETRADVTIGTDTETMDTLTSVNVSWFNPSDQVWATKQTSGGILGQVYTESILFNTSSPAGEWWVEVYWTNGTEVAYDRERFEVHHSANLIADPFEITTEADLTVRGLVRYTDGETNDPLLDASVSLVGNWSGSIISFVANPVQTWWEASFDTSITGAGDFVVIVNASRPFYDDASCQILIHSIRVTRLTSENAPWTAAKWGSMVSLIFKYESFSHITDDWSGIANDTHVRANVNWTIGHWSISEDIIEGVYIMVLNTSAVDAGTWLLNTTFTKSHYESQILLLTLILSPMTSSLSIVGSFSERVDLEESVSVKLRYLNAVGNPIVGANVIIDSVSPANGLSSTAISEVAGEPGNYSMILIPYIATVYTVRFLATKQNAENASTVFVLVVNDVATNLIIYGDTNPSIELTGFYNTTFRFEMYNGTGISNAAIEIVYSGPAGMLDLNWSAIGSGNYSIQFMGRLPGTYLITIAAFKPYHQSSSDSFYLTINNIPTNAILFNTVSTEIGLTDTYNLPIRYEMYNGTGIQGATISVFAPPEVIPQNSSLGSGDYNVEFSVTNSGTYLVTVAASKQYYQSRSQSFFLIVREISTNIISLNGTSALIGFGKDYRFVVRYTNSSGYGIEGANVSVANVVPNEGLERGLTVSEGQGYYSILFTPTTANTFNILIEAKYENHKTQFLLFTLTSTAIATTLNLLNTSTSISLDQSYTLYMRYHDEDFNNLTDAVITSQEIIGAIISPYEEIGDGIYRVKISPLEVGVFDIIFRASKAGYQNDSVSFTLGAVRIPTTLSIASGKSSDTMTYSNEYHLVVLYERTDTGLNISGATIDVQGVPNSDYSWAFIESESGYIVTIIPGRVGTWTFTITAQLVNHTISSVEFTLDVVEILIQVNLLTPSSAVEGQSFEIRVELVENGTSIPVENATVQYRLSLNRAGEFSAMSESIPGIYSAAYRFQLFIDETDYRLEIKIFKDNYKIVQSFDLPFYKENDIVVRMSPLIYGGSGLGFLLVAFFITLRIYSARKKKQLSFDMVNKRRFDDADNLIGVIVLHKKSGIPIYSRIPKGGFDEGIVAAFVSAVTHFREEFEMFDEEQMQVIPISDIIRAVQTRNLICAFITVKSASIEQNRKMEAYAMQVGTYLDDLFDERPSSLIDEKINEMLDYIFDTAMDGYLLKFYKMSTDRAFPKRYQFLAELMQSLETRHCSKPVYLAQGVATFGVSQARGCTLVLEAIDKGLIHICDEHEIKTPEIEFKDYFKRSQNRNGGAEA